MTILEQIPRTAAWTLKRIDLRAEARIRKELRALCAALDAGFAAMWISAPAVEVVAFAGEPALAPNEYPFVNSAAPSFEAVVDRGGAHQLAVVQTVVLGRGMPRAAMEAASFVPVPYTESLDDSIGLFVEQVRLEAARGPVRWRIALFVEDAAGWRTIMLDPGEMGDLDGEIIWSVNRIGRIVGAQAAAFAQEDLSSRSACVSVERRGAAALEVHRLGAGDQHEVASLENETFEILPGGVPGEGLGWQDHDDLDRKWARTRSHSRSVSSAAARGEDA